MTELEIKLLVLGVIKDVIDANTYYEDEGEDFETNLWTVIRELENQYRNEG